VTGKWTNAEFGMRSAELENSASSALHIPKYRSFRTPHSALHNQRGFSLLELMIAMFILIILLSVALPTYHRSVQYAKEKVLQENLWQMRRQIDQYASDKGKYPKSIDDLVQDKYLRERPLDPITDEDKWDEIMDKDPNSPDGDDGLMNVKSTAEGEDSDGKKFSDY
jgi:general secretion pathway protein G